MKVMARFGGGIQTKLMISFLLVGVTPMVIMGILSYSNSSTVLVDQANTQMKSLTAKEIEHLGAFFEIYGAQMDSLFVTMKQAIDYVDVGMAVDVGTKEILSKALADHMKKFPAIRSVRLLDPKGNEKFSTSNQKLSEGNDSASPWFQKALAGREVSISEMFLSKETKEPTVIMAKTAYGQINQDKQSAVIAVEILGEYVTASLKKTKVGKEGYAFALNRDGLVVFHPDKTKVFQLNLGSYPFGKEMLQKKNGLIEYDWEGKRKCASFQDYPALQWIVVATAPKEDILSSINAMRNKFIVLAIVIAGIALVTGFFISSKIAKPIRRAIDGLTEGALQVTSASSQISSASQGLAQGASEQAAGLEETSSSIEEMASMTRQNAGHAGEAKTMMAQASQIVEKVNGHMGSMGEAIAEITRSSEETAKIIKTIDEIAFQTNLLALNAAVEAARAGEAGAGFAVVADEVRNLALRASEAAKNTNDLIKNTVKAVKNGNELTQATQEAFKENMGVSGKIAKLIDEIAAASQEQSHGIEQISRAVAEMDKVVQNNAASAEESASAAEEMHAQAEQMREFVAELVAVVEGSRDGNGDGSQAAPIGQPKVKMGIQKILPIPGWKGKGKTAEGTIARRAKKAIAEQVIPMEEEKFKEF